ncbi:MMPL family transporter [Frankia sp. AgB1.9]|uniref:MMPL family transporter n=1 Tax=unclassified Frankia TaxID=2632575 RepID=UPI001934A36A|nr:MULTISPECIES: MMPL family transporter [unclassified Frankia]MBL7490530.1 MMPL family transporter [Frankia sp. AgW1.1]MBL7550999.1 MMPL family transporter [Frankia sp. AgB1.9]MBL7621220.1 MMPL family transporter [Frankia sp. AgB1.8]
MDVLGRWVIRHRLIVGVVWLAITVLGLLAAPSVSGRLKSGSHVHSSAYTANVAIAKRYGGATSNPGVLVLNLPTGQKVGSPAATAELRAVDARIATAAPAVRLVSYASTGSQTLVGDGGTSTIVLAYPPQQGDDVSPEMIDTLTAAAKSAAPALTVHGTSLIALAAGNTTSGNSSVLTELLIGALGALVVLAWVFGSFLALLPLLMALISVLTMQLLIYGLTYVVPASSPLSPSVQYIVALLGLGLSIDYALLIVTRWREERAAGASNDDAVRTALSRAGHSVWFSGLIASLGLFALIVVPNSVVRGIGISGLFIPSTATLVALTLLPVTLSKLGARMDWPRRKSSGATSRFWTWWAERVIRHRIAAAVVGLGILCGLAGVAATINISQPTSGALASAGPYSDGLRALRTDGFPSGTLTAAPIYVPRAADAAGIVTALDTVSSLRGAVVPTGAAWHVDGSALVIALPAHEIGTSTGGTSLADIRHTVPGTALVGGEAAVGIDEAHSTYGAFPLLFVLVALVTFLILARGLRSILLPLKAVVLNVLSVAASYGILVLVFQHGWGMQALWGTRSYGAIDPFAPVLIFGFLFGVSMDYEVFILTRVREGYHRSGSTRLGIIEGISRTGRLVTSAALVLFFALASLSTANDITVRQIAAGLAAGVLLDAVVVRMLLLPALVSLFGAWNWWMPARIASLLRLPAQTTEADARERIALPVGDA